MNRTEGTFELELLVARRGFRLEMACHLPAAGTTAVLGPSGAGKTTLLRAIAGFERPRGKVSVNGDVWQDDSNGTFLPPHRRAFGYVAQGDDLFPHSSVKVNLSLGQRFVAPAQRRVAFEHVVAVLGLEPWLEHRPDHLSGGQRRRVALGRALLTSPSLLLLDEPFAGLDEPVRVEFCRALRRLGDEFGIPQLHVSHSLEDLLRVADHVLLLDRGRLVDQGGWPEVLSRGHHESLFPGECGVLISRNGRRYWVRSDHLLLSRSTAAPSSAVCHFEVCVSRVDTESDGTIVIHCDGEPGEFRIRLNGPQAVALALNVGCALHATATSWQALD